MGYKLKGKVILITLLSLFAIGVLSYQLINKAYTDYVKSEKLKTSITIAERVSLLVHELQKERGRTAGFLGSGGKTFSQELKEQRKETDRRIAQLKEVLSMKTVQALPPKEREFFINLINDQLPKLIEIRNRVDNLSIPLNRAIEFYTRLNNKLIDSIGLLSSESTNPEIARELLSYADFMYAKEKAGLERAILSVAFANNKFLSNEHLEKFIDLMAQQKAFLKAFQLAAPENVYQYYIKTVKSSVPYQEVKKYEELAISKSAEGNFNVDPDVWFQTITEKINLMKQVEDFIAKDLLHKINQIIEESKHELTTVIVISSIALIIIGGTALLSLREG